MNGQFPHQQHEHATTQRGTQGTTHKRKVHFHNIFHQIMI